MSFFPIFPIRHRLIVLSAIFALALIGCSDDEPLGPGDCPQGEEWNPVLEDCITTIDNSDPTTNEQTNQQSQTDVGNQTEEDVDNSYIPDPCGPGQSPTTIRGTVTIPSGELPLPDATVYVPQGEVEPLAQGASCRRCEDELNTNSIVDTTTNVDGQFTLHNAPVGEDIPLVVEVGKWRRQATIPSVPACQVTEVDPEKTRLPQNREEGQMPRIAVTTGECDALECLIRKVGISDSEITTDSGDGNVHLFSGREGTDRFADNFNNGEVFTNAQSWWNDANNLLDYDIVVHSCECDTYISDKEDGMEAFQKFTDRGGRAFLSHLHYGWLSEGTSDMQSVADWNFAAMPGGFDQSATGYINNEFPKGQMLEQWLYNTGTEPMGEFDIYEVRGSVDSIDEDLVQDWISIHEDGSIPGFPGSGEEGEEEEFIQYFSFNTPVGIDEEDQCGRVVFSDIHVSAREMDTSTQRDISSPDHPYPTGCRTDDLSDQEKALVFMFFDLSACIISDGSIKGDGF